ncbi:MAG TPA: GDSL-type esterase/lipase family protein [Chitinophagaceae bacterium]|nr:GDSL-type esterase/lipase family protein [Chitinophagaceae bacterium]
MTHALLCLGDSYTIGELVPLHESFPYQTVQLLRKAGIHFHAPEIIAKTGWTTFELAEHLIHTQLEKEYDYVTLLIGVNNQYQGLAIEDFKNELSFLIKKSIYLTNEKSERVIILSIPDWGITPFAATRNTKQIAEEIDAYNFICESSAKEHHCHFINITSSQRKNGSKSEFLASDKLHPSGKEYSKWAEKVFDVIKGK